MTAVSLLLIKHFYFKKSTFNVKKGYLFRTTLNVNFSFCINYYLKSDNWGHIHIQINKHFPTQSQSRPRSIMHSAQHLLMFFKYPNRNVAWFYSSNTSFQHGCCELKTSYLNTNFKIVKIHNKKNTRRCSSNNKKHYDEILMMQRILVNEDKHRESWVHSSFISLLLKQRFEEHHGHRFLWQSWPGTFVMASA